MNLYSLGKNGGCKRHKEFPFRAQQTVGEHVKKSGAIKKACVSLLKGAPEADVFSEMHADFMELDYPTQRTRDLDEDQCRKEIRRYIKGEMEIICNRNFKSAVAKDVDIGVGELVTVKPDFIRVVKQAGEIEATGEKYDGSITVVNIHTGRNRGSQKSEAESLAKYAMLKYARTLVRPGSTAMLHACDIYLKRADDASINAAKPNFDENFWADGGNNCTYVSELYTGGTATTDTDKRMKKVVDAFNDGFEAEECTEKDCKECELNLLCHYTEPPLRLNKTHVQKTLRGLSLTASQDEAIEYDHGIVRINAGAGVGKTVVVALRAVNLLMSGVKPSEIALMTFTNAGAEEMRTRIQLYNDDVGTGEDISEMKICTFNSFGDDILKEEYERFGFTAPPVVIDEVERNRIIADMLRDNLVVGLNYFHFSTVSQYVKGAVPMAAKVFDIVKKGAYTVLDVDAVYDAVGADRRFIQHPHDNKETIKALIELYDQYDAQLRENNLIEFADQEMMLFELLQQDPYYLEKFGYKHIIVDEFQDTSLQQMQLLKILIASPSFESLMVVGDDSQAIFSFRNTSPEYIINFSKYIGEETDDIYLLENHRCTPEIIEFANKMNEKNMWRVAKNLVATRPHGKPVTVKGFHTYDEEQKYIVEQVKEHIDMGTKPEDIAIICATKYELRKFANLLTQEGIESVSLNPEPLMENSRVRAAIAFVVALENENDTQDIMVYANAMTGGKVMTMTQDEILESIRKVQEMLKAVDSEEVDKKAKLMEYLTLIDLNDDEIYQKFLETLNRKTYEKACEYCKDFLLYGEKNEARREHDYPGVVLTTAHSSKGLEWPVVFASLSKFDEEKNNLHIIGGQHAVDREERRRLLFVTATRARDELYITSRYIAYGQKGKYTYNLFLEDSYDCMGEVFNVSAIEAEAAQIAKEQAAKRKAEREKLRAQLDELLAKGKE